jgi:cobalt-zinc-cadmium efflux system protein
VSALVVAAIIVYEAAGVFRSSVSVLLESTPADVDLASLTASMVAVDGVAEVHDLHVWSLSSEVRALSAHLVLTGHPTLEEAQVVGERAKRAIAGPYSIAHSTLELECERCDDDHEDPCIMDAPDATTTAGTHDRAGMTAKAGMTTAAGTTAAGTASAAGTTAAGTASGRSH